MVGLRREKQTVTPSTETPLDSFRVSIILSAKGRSAWQREQKAKKANKKKPSKEQCTRSCAC